MEFRNISLSSIQLNPDNPNRHDEDKINTLAANIQEFGLINPVTVKRLDPLKDQFELLAGEGRYHAYEKLMCEAKNPKWTEHWSQIPAIIMLGANEGEFKEWGVRLSENKIRSFNWIAECVCFARMRIEGKGLKEIGCVFGLKDETDIAKRAALGDIPLLTDLNVGSAPNVSLEDAIRYLLPLRIETGRDESNGNRRIYDYSEVIRCITLLSSGELSPSDLSTYSSERRLEIIKNQQAILTQSTIDKEKQLIEAHYKDDIAKLRAIQSTHADEIKAAQTQATTQIETLRSQHEAQIRSLTSQITELEQSTETEQLQHKVAELIEDRSLLEGEVTELERKIELVKEQTEAEVSARLRAELIEQLQEEIKADKNEEREKDLDEAYKEHARDMEVVEKEKIKLAKKADELEKKKKALEEKERQLDLEQTKQGKKVNLQAWINDLNKVSGNLIFMLSTATSNGFWDLFDKTQFTKIASSVYGLADEMRTVENIFREKGIIEEKQQ